MASNLGFNLVQDLSDRVETWRDQFVSQTSYRRYERACAWACDETAKRLATRMNEATVEVVDRPTPWMARAWQYRRGMRMGSRPNEVAAETFVKDDQSVVFKFLVGSGPNVRRPGDVGLAKDRILLPVWRNLQDAQGIRPNRYGNLPGGGRGAAQQGGQRDRRQAARERALGRLQGRDPGRGQPPPGLHRAPTPREATLGQERQDDLTMSFEKSLTKTEIRTNEEPGRPVVATDYSEQSGMVKMTFRQLAKLGKALAFMGKSKAYTQAAVAARTVVYESVELLNWLELEESDEDNAQGLIKTVVTAVTVGGEPLTLNVHYWHDSASGIVQVTKWPDGAEDGDDVSVTFSAPAVTVANKVDVVEILSELFMRGRLVVRQNNRRGMNRKFIWPRITIGGDSGSVNIVTDSNDVTTIEVTGTIESDETQPPGRERGYRARLVVERIEANPVIAG